jgi:hypothetical protein
MAMGDTHAEYYIHNYAKLLGPDTFLKPRLGSLLLINDSSLG